MNAMNALVFLIFIVNLLLTTPEYKTTKNMNVNQRFEAIEKLTTISWLQIIIAFANLILCIQNIISQFKYLAASSNAFSIWGLLLDISVGFLSVVIIVARFTPRQSSIKHYMDYWFTVNNRPTVEEFMNSNWSPTQDEDSSGHMISDVKEAPPADTDDCMLSDEPESQDADDTEDAESLDSALIEMLENNDKIGALKLYMDETIESLDTALEHIESLIAEMGDLPEPEYGDENFDGEVDYNILLKSVNDGKTSAARYYSEVSFTDFIQAYDYVKELNEEFGNY